jgi:hypothetical protein
MASARPKKGQAGIKPSIDELAATRARDLQILDLALAGNNGVQIAAELSIDKSTVSRALERIWARTEQPKADAARAKWDMRIEAALAAIWDKVLAGDVAAVHAFCRLEERAAKLHGFDQQGTRDMGALAEALLADPVARREHAQQLRDELAEARARHAQENRRPAKRAAKPRARKPAAG